MKTTNHTPGPWTYSRMRLTPNDKDRRSGFVVNGPDVDPDEFPVRICDLRVPQGINGFAEGEANAALIASAPDLLAERDRLREINAELAETLAIIARMKTVDEFGEALPESEDWVITLTEVIQMARAALAKAKGE